MVSPLWKASSEGNVANLVQILKEATPVDIEVKDHTGVTPLIEAVKNGHVEVVRILLEKGADPTNASSQGPPESYTSDPAIFGLLSTAKNKIGQPSVMPPDNTYIQEQPADTNAVDPATAGYYPPPGGYYYPPMHVAPPMLSEGNVPYYMPPPMPTGQNPGGLGNLPPPEVARMIPCRYYPACRYGTSCMFAHPQGPYVQAPLSPPSQYPSTYDSMNTSPYPPSTYYPVPATNYPAPPNGAPVGHMSPPPLVHTTSSSEVMSPIQSPYTPSHGQPPVPYGLVSPVSPNTYGHHGPVPITVPVQSLPPVQTSPTASQSPPQPVLYTPISPSVQGGAPPYAMTPQYAPQKFLHNGDTDLVSPKSPVDGYNAGPIGRDMTHQRRGSARRPPFGGRGGKPPCLFFPSGRCRNGDDCRFPHVVPDGTGSQSHFSARGGHRPRPPYQANGVATLEEKFAAITTQDDKLPQQRRNGTDNSTESSRSHSIEAGQKGRVPLKNHSVNGIRQDRKFGPTKPQRVPSADEFPVLCSVPLSRASSNGANPGYPGPTAAQVLQAPPPRREAHTRVGTPEQSVAASTPKEVNGAVPESIKLPLSFAAAATEATNTKEVSVSA